MVLSKRSTYDEDGGYQRIIEYREGESEYETVVLRVPPDSENEFVCYGYDEGDDPVFQASFETRELAFDPVSVLGIGERERLGGVTALNVADSEERSPRGSAFDARRHNDDYHRVPRDIYKALNALGFAVVPGGRWWLDAIDD